RAFAKRSMAVAASFGLASALSVVVLGDESGYTATEHQKMKIAAIEAMWETEPAPAGFALFGFPDVDARETHAEVKIPWALGLIATRSIDEEIPGINELVEHNRERIVSGVQAHGALQELRENPDNTAARERFDAHREDLGHGLLLLRHVDDPAEATEADIDAAAESTIPDVPVLFWAFRVMVALGFFFIALFAFAFYLSAKQQLERHRWFLTLACVALPLPWIAAELGWIVAEYGRQPWSIEGVLPTFLGVSATSATNVVLSLTGFVVFYTALLVVDVFLMQRMIRRGPDGLGYWPATGAPTQGVQHA
ncbi:cytochrome ubiquinol oxidase subunit I, partial [uncultured Abyssibacter sp.]|uniref:cytochrome ubiquinol oxidase subunit I n=1 Tax=uncultured Abyssibacter sp. TaxID=2320202 RepID=UPI0032B1ABD8